MTSGGPPGLSLMPTGLESLGPEVLQLRKTIRDLDLVTIQGINTQSETRWYENLDGAGGFGAPRIISTEADSATAVFAADVNGDSTIEYSEVAAFIAAANRGPGLKFPSTADFNSLKL